MMPVSNLRTLANIMIFGGWMLPAALAYAVRARVDIEAGGRIAGLFNIIAGFWAVLAIAYALVIAMRMRRGITDG